MPLNPLFFLFSGIFLVSFWLGWTRLIGAEWWPTPKENLPKIMKMANVNPNTVFYDLGCGGGRLVVEAAKEHGAKAIGIEVDPLRFLTSWLRVKLSGAEEAEIEFGNFFDENLKPADVVFIFQRGRINEELKGKLKEELRPGSKVVTYYWPFEGWEPNKVDKENKIYLYEI